MKIPYESDDIFNCPEGGFKGVIERLGEPKTPIKKACKVQVRVTIRVTSSTGKEYLVARTFCADLRKGSELYNFLDSWLDGNFEQFVGADGQMDLNLLIGKEVDVLVSHYDGGTHGKPFVKIAGIFPRGTLVKE